MGTYTEVNKTHIFSIKTSLIDTCGAFSKQSEQLVSMTAKSKSPVNNAELHTIISPNESR